MNISPIANNYNDLSFEHRHHRGVKQYSAKEQAIVAASSALGVAASLACLAKTSGYSLNPLKMFKNCKNSYIAKTPFLAPQIISIGAGTCLGGLAGGYIIDKDPVNRKAKKREAVMQMGNISIPISTVALFEKFTSKYGKASQALGTIAGVFTGVYLANFLMNKLGNILFKNKHERGVEIVDFSAHFDDVVASASYMSPDSKIVHAISRIVPAILVIPGFEVGTKTHGQKGKAK